MIIYIFFLSVPIVGRWLSLCASSPSSGFSLPPPCGVGVHVVRCVYQCVGVIVRIWRGPAAWGTVRDCRIVCVGNTWKDCLSRSSSDYACYYLLFFFLSFHYLGAILGFEAKGKHHKEGRGQNFRTLVDSPSFWAMPTIWTGTVFFEISCLLCFVCFMSVSLIVFVAASLFFLPAVFVFVFVGEFVSVSVSVFVFVEVPLLVALFVIVGLLLLVIPKVFFGQCI